MRAERSGPGKKKVGGAFPKFLGFGGIYFFFLEKKNKIIIIKKDNKKKRKKTTEPHAAEPPAGISPFRACLGKYCKKIIKNKNKK